MKIKQIFVGFIVFAMLLSFSSAVLADTEPNDTFGEANLVFDGDVIYGSLNDVSDDTDYYKIWLGNNETITVDLSGPFGADFDITLYDEFESSKTDSSSGSSTEHLTYNTFFSGNYYIKVNALSGSGTYILTIDVSSVGIQNPGDPWVGGDPYIEGEPKATVPTWGVGDGWYFGGIVDIEEEMSQELETGLKELEDMGFDVSLDQSGGFGAYFGLEVISNNAEINGYTSYDVQVTGAFAMDYKIDVTVTGSSNLGFGANVNVDATGNLIVSAEANLDGHIYFTVDELALVKIELTLTAEADAEGTVDADISAMGESTTAQVDATFDITGAKIDFDLTFDPPLDVFQFDFWKGKKWYVPASDTVVTGSLNAQGTVTTSAQGTVDGEPINEGETVDLATEIGDNDFRDEIPGGQPSDNYWGYDVGGGTLFECTFAADNIFIIETDVGNTFSYFPSFGTRQFGLDPSDLMPDIKPGMQFDANEGFITGATMNGDVITDEVTKEDVQSFSADPLEEVTKETGGAAGKSNLLTVMFLIIIVAVVAIVIVVAVKKKKGGPEETYGEGHAGEYQQPDPNQQYQPPPQQYEQPPPPPQDPYQQPPQDQYQQQPPGQY